jgi:hypothetical protein
VILNPSEKINITVGIYEQFEIKVEKAQVYIIAFGVNDGVFGYYTFEINFSD